MKSNKWPVEIAGNTFYVDQAIGGAAIYEYVGDNQVRFFGGEALTASLTTLGVEPGQVVIIARPAEQSPIELGELQPVPAD